MQNEAKRRPLAGSPKHETRNPKQADSKEHNYAKQTQFPPAKVNVNACSNRDYENNIGLGRRKSKANRSQFAGLSFLHLLSQV